jgi:hypothetical protein
MKRMSEYEYDDPERERGAVVKAYREAGLPAAVAVGLLDDAVVIDGLDAIEACRQTMGHLVLLLDPEVTIMMSRAMDDDAPERAVRDDLRVVVERALERMPPDELAEAQIKYEDTQPDSERDQMAALVRDLVADADRDRVYAEYLRYRRQGKSGSEAWLAVYSDLKPRPM